MRESCQRCLLVQPSCSQEAMHLSNHPHFLNYLNTWSPESQKVQKTWFRSDQLSYVVGHLRRDIGACRRLLSPRSPDLCCSPISGRCASKKSKIKSSGAAKTTWQTARSWRWTSPSWSAAIWNTAFAGPNDDFRLRRCGSCTITPSFFCLLKGLFFSML